MGMYPRCERCGCVLRDCAARTIILVCRCRCHDHEEMGPGA